MSTRVPGAPLPAAVPRSAAWRSLALAPVALASLLAAPGASAQSTGSIATEEELTEVTVTARRGPRAIGNVTEQNAAKSRVTVTEEYLATQVPGQSVFQSLNLVPGVNFTNNDPYGSSGGNLRLRSFDGSRVSVTFDGRAAERHRQLRAVHQPDAGSGTDHGRRREPRYDGRGQPDGLGHRRLGRLPHAQAAAGSGRHGRRVEG